MHAVIDKNTDIVQLLLESGATVSVQDRSGNSALHFAAQEYCPEITKILVSHGAEVDARDQHGNTPLRKLAETIANYDELRFFKSRS